MMQELKNKNIPEIQTISTMDDVEICFLFIEEHILQM